METNGKINRGVYFLADDRLVDLVIAFLNSFRKYNPTIQLCLIPYNSNIYQLKQLRQKYNFSIYSNAPDLAGCDDISQRFYGKASGNYRKLAAWQGDFEEFIYIDVDTIVLESVDFVFDHLDSYAFIASHSDWPQLKKHVWKNSIDASGQLTPQQISYSVNTGFIASKKGSLDLQIIKEKLEEAIALSKHMEMRCVEQPLINYLIVTSGKPYTSLSVLYYQKGHPHKVKLELWAGRKGLRVKDGKIYAWGKYPPVFLVHWAGQWQPIFFDRIIYFILRLLGLKKKTDYPGVRFFMPYKKLWKYYRYNF